MVIDTQPETADAADDDGHPFRRSQLQLGAKLYFNGREQFDGYRTEECALEPFRGEDGGVSLGETITIVARQLSGIYEAEVIFGERINEYGGLRASAWKWERPIPSCVAFYEVLVNDIPGWDLGNDINKLLMGQYSHPWGKVAAPSKKVLRVACWVDLGANEYVVQLRRVKTHIGSPPVKGDADA